MAEYDSDVIVVGGGLAGICSAIELLDRNLQVTILDRDCEQNFGGLAKESFGGIFVVGSPEQRRVGAMTPLNLHLPTGIHLQNSSRVTSGQDVRTSFIG